MEEYGEIIYNLCIGKSIDCIEEVFKDTPYITEYRMCDEKIDDKVDDSEDVYVMSRSYDIVYRDIDYHVLLYFGDNSRKIECIHLYKTNI